MRRFRDLKDGEKFRISHLKECNYFTKVEPNYSHGDYYIFRDGGQLDSLYFKGMFNAYSDYGRRWWWDADQEVEEYEPKVELTRDQLHKLAQALWEALTTDTEKQLNFNVVR